LRIKVWNGKPMPKPRGTPDKSCLACSGSGWMVVPFNNGDARTDFDSSHDAWPCSCLTKRRMSDFAILLTMSGIVVGAMFVTLGVLGMFGPEGAPWFLLALGSTGWASFLTLALLHPATRKVKP
jgi:hypothetical protein